MAGGNLIARILVCMFFLQAVSSNKTSVAHLCTEDRSCFGMPSDCEVDDCEILLSIQKNGTEFVVRDTDFGKYFFIRSETKGVMSATSFVCFPGSTKCYVGIQENNERFKVEKKVIVHMTEIDSAMGDYLYSTNVIFLETGDDVKYYAKIDQINNEMSTSNGTQLEFLSTGPKTKVAQNIDIEANTITLDKIIKNQEGTLPIDFAHNGNVSGGIGKMFWNP